MRIQDVILITSLLALIFLHSGAREKRGQDRDIRLKVIVEENDRTKVIEKHYEHLDQLAADTIWSKLDIGIDIRDLTDSALTNFSGNAIGTAVRLLEDSLDENAIQRKKIVIETTGQTIVVGDNGDHAGLSKIGADMDSLLRKHGIDLHLSHADSAENTGKREVQIIIRTEADKEPE